MNTDTVVLLLIFLKHVPLFLDDSMLKNVSKCKSSASGCCLALA